MLKINNKVLILKVSVLLSILLLTIANTKFDFSDTKWHTSVPPYFELNSYNQTNASILKVIFNLIFHLNLVFAEVKNYCIISKTNYFTTARYLEQLIDVDNEK